MWLPMVCCRRPSGSHDGVRNRKQWVDKTEIGVEGWRYRGAENSGETGARALQRSVENSKDSSIGGLGGT